MSNSNYKKILSEISPVLNNIKYDLPIPKLNPDQRLQRRLAYRNERFLFRNKSSLSGKDLITIYHPDSDLKIISKEEWQDTDNKQFSADFDFSKTFFEQFHELSSKTYKQALVQAGNVQNSDYTHFCGYIKDCYLLFDSGKSEGCIYGVFVIYSKDCFDCSYIIKCELCYQSTYLKDCYKVFYSDFSRNCNNSAFIYDCTGCSYCLFCTNLTNAKYHVFNKPVSEEEFNKTWNNLFSHTRSSIEKAQDVFQRFLKTNNTRVSTNINCSDTTGNLNSYCDNVVDSYHCSESKNIFYCMDLHGGNENCIDYSGFGEAAYSCYELTASGGSIGKIGINNCYFSAYVYYGGYNVLYSTNVHEQSSDLFGCTDLRKSQYCILNKQYSRQEYYKLVDKIINHMKETGEWGEFFPLENSSFPYNHSLANELFPMIKNDAKDRKLNWIDDPANEVNGTLAYQGDKSDFEKEFSTKNIVSCSKTNKNFNLTSTEYEFYKANKLPIPNLHYYQRHLQRMLVSNQL